MKLPRVAPLLFFAASACSVATPQADIMTAPVAEEAVEAPTETVPVAAKPKPAPLRPARPGPIEITFAGSEMTQGGWIRGTLPEGTAKATLGDTAISFDEDGHFFAAFDRDAPSTLQLKAESETRILAERALAIAPRAWDIERVNVAKGTGGGGEAWWARREPEWLAIKEARERETGAQGWRQAFIWPVTGRISGRFGRQRIYRGEPGSYHSGIDIAPGDGTPFVAPADGVVVLARTGFSLEGGIIILDHGAGLNSAFIHLSHLSVSEGETVRQGQKLGNVGASGRATGPHLHWSLVWKDNRLDPLLFLPPMP